MQAGGVFFDESGCTRSRSYLQEEAARLSEELRTKGWRPGMSAILVASPSLEFISHLLMSIHSGLHVILSSARSLLEIQAEFGSTVHGTLDPGQPLSHPRPPNSVLFPFTGPTINLFTSGTTGAPKIVTLDSKAIHERAEIECEIFDLTEKSQVLCVMHPSYELGLNQIFSTLHAGGTLTLANSPFPATIVEQINTRQPDGIIATPQFWTNLTNRRDPSLTLTHELSWLSISGGRVSQSVFDDVRGLFPQARIFHTYGKTETGRSLYGLCQDALILDRTPLGIHVEIQNGELIHWGRGLGLNSIGERFLEHHTGDLFAQDTKGAYIFRGRTDHLVKYLDFRISLEEIEAVLNRHPSVAQSICVLEEGKGRWDGDHTLVAYVEVRNPITANDLRTFLHSHLSAHKVPRSFRFVHSWPLTRSMKIDRKRVLTWEDWSS